MKKNIVFFIFVFLMGCSSSNLRGNKEVVRGMYVYFADSAILFKCNTGERIFIGGGDGNIALERRYLDARKEVGDKVYVELRGRYEMAPKMDGEGLEKVFFVSEVISVDNEKECF